MILIDHRYRTIVNLPRKGKNHPSFFSWHVLDNFPTAIDNVHVVLFAFQLFPDIHFLRILDDRVSNAFCDFSDAVFFADEIDGKEVCIIKVVPFSMNKIIGSTFEL